MRKESKTRDIKLTPTEKLAITKALQLHYLNDAEKLGTEKGFQVKKKTLNDLIIGIGPMLTGEVR